MSIPKSKRSNESPWVNASVTVSVAPVAGATNVHAGAPMNVEFPDTLGKQANPAGSAGAQPEANVWVGLKENSDQSPPMGTGVDCAGTASPRRNAPEMKMD
jgi:hypothetical protein